MQKITVLVETEYRNNPI